MKYPYYFKGYLLQEGNDEEQLWLLFNITVMLQTSSTVPQTGTISSACQGQCMASTVR
jgi:hypothetical protein